MEDSVQRIIFTRASSRIKSVGQSSDILIVFTIIYVPIVALTPLVSMTVWRPHCLMSSFINLTVFYINDPLIDGGILVTS